MISLYVPGHGPLHRCPAGVKVLALALLSLGLALAPASVWTIDAAVLVAAAAIALAALRPGIVGRDLLRTLPFVVFIGGTLWLFQDFIAAATGAARILAIFTLASVLSRTTRVSDMMEVWPFRLSERLALSLSLVMTMIPALTAIGAQVRDAQRSRGLRPSVKRWLMPFLVLSLRHADDVDDALRARVPRSTAAQSHSRRARPGHSQGSG